LTTYVLDSDFIIDCLTRRRDALTTLEQLEPQGLAASIITYAELYEGIAGSRTREEDERRLADFLADVELLGVDIEIARIFGDRRAALRAQGTLIDNFDQLIAATALRFDLALATRNTRDFERIEGLRLHA
jgi:tRNA(fMet)-specific endonuclease VapC